MDYENQKMLETFFNARQTPALLRRELLASHVVVKTIQNAQLDEEFALDLLTQLILFKRCHITQLIGMLKGHFARQGDPYQACANALLQAAERDLCDFEPKTDQFIVIFDVDAKTRDLIAQYQYLPPMVIPPLEVTGNRGSGYLTIRTDSLLLKDNHHEGDLCLDSINRFNRIALSINTEVATGIENKWKHLDKPKADETFEDYQKRVKAFERYQKDAAFTMALMVEMGNRFHLTHKTDKRGRTYAQGYHINYQGNCWNKAVLELADKEMIHG